MNLCKSHNAHFYANSHLRFRDTNVLNLRSWTLKVAEYNIRSHNTFFDEHQPL